MTTETDTVLVERSKTFATVFGLAVAGTGIIVILGWVIGNPVLKSLHPSFVSMKANTAVAFILAGAALYLKAGLKGRSKMAADTFAVLVAAIGLATLIEYLLGMNFGIDTLLFNEPTGAAGTVHPGRMAPNTAFAFVLSGLGLIIMDRRADRKPLSGYLFLFVWLIGFFALTGYIFGSESLYGLARYTKMAVHTAVAFMVLSTGGMAARIERGFFTLLVSKDNAGSVARTLLPFAIGVPVVAGWLRLEGQVHGFYDMNFGLALFVIVMVIAFSCAVLWCSYLIAGAEKRRKVLEKDLLLKTEELDRFFTVSLDLLCIAGLNGRFIRLNPAWEDVLGYPLHELEGCFFIDYIHPDDVEATLAAVEKQAGGKTVTHFINRYRCKDGSYRWIEWNSVPSNNLLFAAARDITVSKTAEEDLKKVNQELEAFAYSVSHDLRAPLRAIDGFTRILEEDYSGSFNEEGKRICSVIRKNTVLMGRLIDDLLAFSRLGRAQIAAQPIHMKSKVKSVFDELTTSESRERIELTIEPLPTAEGDPTMIRQVWMNLMGNAIKFSAQKDKAVITVSGSENDRETVYRITDNGAGFDSKYADKLFGVFQRLHSTRDFEGTGVGLAIVKRVVSRHGGRVWAESNAGQGASFGFTLPKRLGKGELP